MNAPIKKWSDGILSVLRRESNGPGLFPRLRSAPALDPLYYFLHVPKTAGTSIDSLLRDGFEVSRAAPTVDPIDLMRMSKDELNRFDYISGHLEFGYYLDQLLERPVRTITFLREPRSLLLSVYKQVRREKADPMFAYVDERCPDVDSFFHDPVMSKYVANFQTRYLGESERRFDLQLLDAIRSADRQAIPAVIARTHDARRRNPPTARELLRRAVQRLRGCWFVGLTETLEASMNELAARLGWESLPELPWLNRSENDVSLNDLTTSVVKRLDMLTVLDQTVYAEAARIYRSKWRRMWQRWTA